MKARVKATDRTIEVMCVMNREGVAVWEDIGGISTNPNQYNSDELEFIDFPEMPIATYTPDYWTRLEHQAAIAAMQWFLAGRMEDTYNRVAEFSINQAHALVEKMKEESK